MELLKKHYEKVILSVMLFLLVVAAAMLPLQVAREQQSLQELRDSVVRTPPKPFKPLDLSTNKAMLARFEKPAELKLAGEHNIFNPVRWRKASDGSLVKLAGDGGPSALVIGEVVELNLIIAYQSMAGDVSNPRYRFRVVRETDSNPRPTTVSAHVRERTEYFDLVEVKGPAENPAEFIVQVKGKLHSVKPGQPLILPIGFAADLIYPPEKQRFVRQRVKDTIRLEGNPTETYKIVSIEPFQVTFESNSTGKRYTIKADSNQKSTG